MAFNGAFLPSTVGMAVVDGDMKEGFKRVFMEKLRAIIGENRLKFVAVGAKVAAKTTKCGGHGGLRNGWKGVHIETTKRCWIAIVGSTRVRMPPRPPEEWTVSIWKCPGSV